MLDVEIAARSEIGQRRHNEDDLRHGHNGPIWFAVLSDGAGGHHGGAIASDLVVRMMAHGLQAAPDITPQSLSQLVHDTNAALNEPQAGKSGRDRMHATVVALWIDIRREQALWTHVGDTRLYLLRHGRVHTVTEDDSIVQRMVQAGYLSAADARNHPKKNQLLSAMGASEHIEPNTTEQAISLSDGDAFLLCTDGWWDHLDHAEIERHLAQADTPAQWLDLMAEQVRQGAQHNQDNYSAIAVWIGDPTEITRIDP